MDADIGAQSNSLGKFGKITEHPQSSALALFGMELRRKQIVAPDHGSRKGTAIVRLESDRRS